MKYKIAVILVIIVTIALSIFLPLLNRDDIYRYHQHTDSKAKTVCNCNDNFCSNLPLISIKTDNGVNIPGRAIRDENGKLTGYTTTPDIQDTVMGSIDVIDNYDTYNHITDTPSASSKVIIHVRGNSSREYDKPGYKINLINDDGSNNDKSLIGMSEHHEWALHGPFLDKTLIRNYMWYNIAGEIMSYAPNVRFCELIINGEYRGVYLLVETITAGKNGARLNMSVDKKNNSFTGYVLRVDRGSTVPEKNIETFTQYAKRVNNPKDIVYPGVKNLSDDIRKGIELDFSTFEKSLYSYDYDNEFGYKKSINIDSFVDYFIINEFTCNYDAGWLSTYIYKDIGGLMNMCVWDFNSACDYYQYSQTQPHEFRLQNAVWYFMLVKDEDFTDRICKRYKSLRKTYLSDEYLNNYIDETVKFLGPAIDRNYQKWGYSFEEEYDFLEPAERNVRTYDEAIIQLKEFISERSKWMDENIDTIRQYSSESKVKKFNENAN